MYIFGIFAGFGLSLPFLVRFGRFLHLFGLLHTHLGGPGVVLMIFQISSYFWRVLDSRYSKNTSNIVPGWDEIYIFGTYVFWAIAAVFGPIWAIPSHVWMIMDPSWGSWGRFDDFELFL